MGFFKIVVWLRQQSSCTAAASWLPYSFLFSVFPALGRVAPSWQLKLVCSSTSKGSDALFLPPWAWHACVYSDTHRHIHKQILKQKSPHFAWNGCSHSLSTRKAETGAEGSQSLNGLVRPSSNLKQAVCVAGTWLAWCQGPCFSPQHHQRKRMF